MLEAEISRRPLSTVYRAIQPTMNRTVALKIFHVREAQREAFIHAFRRDVQIVAKLEHIRIVPVYDYGVNGDEPFLVMRQMRGSLAELLRSGPLPTADAIDIILQISTGLAYAHSRGVLHGDLKPDNILLDEFGNAYLSDFGISQLEKIAFDGANPADPINRAVYDAPEVLRGQLYDEPADQYSMAAVLYHLLTGHPPVAQRDVNAPETTPPPVIQRVEQLNPSVSPAIGDVVMRGLSVQPELRYNTVHALAAALSTASGRSIGTSTELRVPAVAVRQRSRLRSRGLIVLPVVVLLMIGMIALVFAQNNSRHTPTVLAGQRGPSSAAVPSTEDVQGARAALGDKGFVAFIACTTGTQTGQMRAQQLKSTAESYGLDFRVYDSGMDRYKQLTQLERAQLDGASALIVCALDTDVLNNSLAAIQQAHLPLVFMAPYEPSYGGVMIDTDNYALGAKAGAYAGKLLQEDHQGKGNIVVLTYPDIGSMSDRTRGIIEQLQASAPAATVLGIYAATTPELATKSIAALLRQGKKIDMIVSVSDAAAEGAVEALRTAKIPPDAVSIVSINGEPQARDLIAKGEYLRGSVNVDQGMASKMAIDAVVRLLAGETLPETLDYAAGDLITRDTLTPEATAAQ